MVMTSINQQIPWYGFIILFIDSITSLNACQMLFQVTSEKLRCIKL